MSSTTNTAAGAIRSRFSTQWASLRSYNAPKLKERVAWDNVPFTPPDAEWVRLSILWGDGFEMTAGDTGVGETETVGVVSVQIFTQPGTGSGLAEQMAEDARDIFNRVDLSGSGYVIRFGAPSGPKPAQRDGWWQQIVDTPFSLEETV